MKQLRNLNIDFLFSFIAKHIPRHPNYVGFFISKEKEEFKNSKYK
jgi:hypothetical protein